MPSYDSTRFDPPAPVAEVTLHSPDKAVSVSGVLMLLDTGADITLIPQSAIQDLGVSPITDNQYELMGFDGTKSQAAVVELVMVLLDKGFRGKYLVVEKEYGILGRAVLNHLQLLLNGPKLKWNETTGKNTT